MISSQLVAILILLAVYFLGFGLGIGKLFDARPSDIGYWLLLSFGGLFSYNVIAFFAGWTIYGGPGGTISSDSGKFNRVGGAIVSALAAILMLYFWFDRLIP